MSITLNGVSFPLTYTDCATDFWEVAGATLSVDAWGMDKLTRRYQGRLDKVATELAKYKRDRGKRDSIYPWMYVTDVTMTESAPFAELVVNHAGIYDGKIPKPVITDSGFRRQTVQLANASDIGFTSISGTCNVTYSAPFVRVNFVSDKKRLFPQHQSLLDARQLSVLRQSNGHSGQLKLVRGSSLASPGNTKTQALSATIGSFNGIIEVHSEIHGQKKVGQWWTGSESHEIVIVPMEQRLMLHMI